MLTDLLRRFFQDGDAAAMENLVRRTRGRLLSIARRIGAAQDAEDSVQAAYHALLRHGAFRGPVSVEAWLTTAVVRIAYRRKALALRQTRLAERLACDRDDADPHAAAVRCEEIALVRRAVTHLPSRYRDVLVLRHIEGLTVEETARLLDAPESTVKTRTRRGLALLRARVGPRAAWALMVGPWLLADVLRSTTTWGTVMTAKTTMTMAGVALAVTAVGLGVGMNLSKDAPTQRAASESRHSDASLRDDVERLRARAESAERALAQARPPASASEQAELPPSLVREGRRLGVSDAALAAASAAKEAWDAFRKNRRTSAKWDEAMAALQTFGGEGFLAVLAHLRANPEPTGNYFKLFASTWEEGMEAHLIDLAQDSHASLKQRKHALLCLGGSRIDTPGVRDFLVAELERGGDIILAAE